MMDNSYCQDYAPVLELDAGLKWVHKRRSFIRERRDAQRASFLASPTDRPAERYGGMSHLAVRPRLIFVGGVSFQGVGGIDT